jgi:hypothetical protein
MSNPYAATLFGARGPNMPVRREPHQQKPLEPAALQRLRLAMSRTYAAADMLRSVPPCGANLLSGGRAADALAALAGPAGGRAAVTVACTKGSVALGEIATEMKQSRGFRCARQAHSRVLWAEAAVATLTHAGLQKAKARDRRRSEAVAELRRASFQAGLESPERSIDSGEIIDDADDDNDDDDDDDEMTYAPVVNAVFQLRDLAMPPPPVGGAMRTRHREQFAFLHPPRGNAAPVVNPDSYASKDDDTSDSNSFIVMKRRRPVDDDSNMNESTSADVGKAKNSQIVAASVPASTPLSVSTPSACPMLPISSSKLQRKVTDPLSAAEISSTPVSATLPGFSSAQMLESALASPCDGIFRGPPLIDPVAEVIESVLAEVVADGQFPSLDVGDQITEQLFVAATASIPASGIDEVDDCLAVVVRSSPPPLEVMDNILALPVLKKALQS